MVFNVIILPWAGIAQDNLIDWSAPIEIPKSEEILAYTLVDDSIPSIISRFGDAIIQRSFTNPIADFPLFIRTDKDPELLKQQIVNDKLFTIEMTKHDDSVQHNLVIYKLGSQRSSRTKEIPLTIENPVFGNESRPVFFSVSKNAEHVLVCQQESFKKQLKTHVNLIISTDQGADNYSLPSEFDGDDLELLGGTIDNNGIAYFATETGIKLNSPFRKKYLVYSFNPKSRILTEFDLTSSEFFILDLTVSTNDKGALISCLYSTDPLIEDKSMGYTFVQLSENGLEIQKRHAGSFKDEMITKFEEDDFASGAIKDLYLAKTMIVNDSPWLIMEKRYQSRVCTSDPHTGIMTCSDQFHFNAVAFESIMDPDKSVIVNKRQIDYDRPSLYTSQAIIQSEEHIYMFYNDHFKNTHGQGDYTMSNPNRSALRFIQIDETSRPLTGLLTSERQSDFVFVPSFGIEQFESSAYLLSADGKYFRFGKLNLNKLQGEN